MHGIYIAAAVTSVLAAASGGTIIRKLNQPADRRWLLLAALVTLPLQPLAFYLVRLPLDHWLVAQLGRSSMLYQWLTSFYAPLTEEPAKLIALLIPALRRDIRPENFARYALCIGLGFALGEIWFVAERVSHQPALAHVPFYQFNGYAVERLMTCVFHSAFVALSLWQLRRRFWLGFCGAMAAHWLANFPILLMHWNTGGLGRTTWSLLVNLWLVVLFIGALALLSWFLFEKISPARVFFGLRHCPECAHDYDAPLFGINLGTRRYERCPHCRRWHWTKSGDA